MDVAQSGLRAMAGQFRACFTFRTIFKISNGGGNERWSACTSFWQQSHDLSTSTAAKRQWRVALRIQQLPSRRRTGETSGDCHPTRADDEHCRTVRRPPPHCLHLISATAAALSGSHPRRPVSDRCSCHHPSIACAWRCTWSGTAPLAWSRSAALS